MHLETVSGFQEQFGDDTELVHAPEVEIGDPVVLVEDLVELAERRDKSLEVGEQGADLGDFGLNPR